MGKVKCSDCGLLALRAKTDQYVLYQSPFVPPSRRYRDLALVDCEPKIAGCDYEPVCSAGVYDYAKEFQKDTTDRLKMALGIIHDERECDEFRKWRYGFSPKEHLEMKRDEQIVQDNRTWHTSTISAIGSNYESILKRSQIRMWLFGLASTILGGIGGAILTIIMAKYFGLSRQGTSVGTGP